MTELLRVRLAAEKPKVFVLRIVADDSVRIDFIGRRHIDALEIIRKKLRDRERCWKGLRAYELSPVRYRLEHVDTPGFNRVLALLKNSVAS